MLPVISIKECKKQKSSKKVHQYISEKPDASLQKKKTQKKNSHFFHVTKQRKNFEDVQYDIRNCTINLSLNDAMTRTQYNKLSELAKKFNTKKRKQYKTPTKKAADSVQLKHTINRERFSKSLAMKASNSNQPGKTLSSKLSMAVNLTSLKPPSSKEGFKYSKNLKRSKDIRGSLKALTKLPATIKTGASIDHSMSSFTPFEMRKLKQEIFSNQDPGNYVFPARSGVNNLSSLNLEKRDMMNSRKSNVADRVKEFYRNNKGSIIRIIKESDYRKSQLVMYPTLKDSSLENCESNRYFKHTGSNNKSTHEDPALGRKRSFVFEFNVNMSNNQVSLYKNTLKQKYKLDASKSKTPIEVLTHEQDMRNVTSVLQTHTELEVHQSARILDITHKGSVNSLRIFKFIDPQILGTKDVGSYLGISETGKTLNIKEIESIFVSLHSALEEAHDKPDLQQESLVLSPSLTKSVKTSLLYLKNLFKSIYLRPTYSGSVNVRVNKLDIATANRLLSRNTPARIPLPEDQKGKDQRISETAYSHTSKASSRIPKSREAHKKYGITEEEKVPSSILEAYSELKSLHRAPRMTFDGNSESSLEVASIVQGVWNTDFQPNGALPPS